MRLDGKVAVVTGSSKGIGLAIARRFIEAGARVVVNSRSAETSRALARQLGMQERVLGIGANVAEPHEARRLVQDTVHHFGRVDIMVCNAGTSLIQSAEQVAVEDWTAVIDLNLSGVFYTAQAAAQEMMGQGGGNILLIGSILGRVGLPGRAAYCATKHALVGLTKVLALDWAPHGIRVNNLSPGYVTSH